MQLIYKEETRTYCHGLVFYLYVISQTYYEKDFQSLDLACKDTLPRCETIDTNLGIIQYKLFIAQYT